MRMEQVEIFERDGVVIIAQEDPFGDEPATICLSPDQIGLVCDVLRDLAVKASR